ncbi:MAG: galactokinase [Puniceicoccales bacterium]|jgi:galactokinase|nr:galactokinase [Puniceicoccales bacterium]
MSTRNYFFSQFNSVPAFSARAPGRIEFIGNHLDYNGGPVLGAAINRYVTVAVGPRSDEKIVLVSAAQSDCIKTTLDAAEQPLSGAEAWGNYPLGMLKVMRDAGMSVYNGFNIAVTNDLPLGTGLSSSAALELATGYALAAFHGFALDRKRIAVLGRAAENSFVGMPCGILDQGTVAFGRAGALVLIDCEKETFSTRSLPAGTHFWIFNTLKKHSLVDSLYATRHRECAEAFEILRRADPVLINLAAASETQIEAARAALGTERFKRALHVARETARVHDTLDALDAGDLPRVGRNLTASHESSRLFFENSCDELDFLAERVAGAPDVFGARLSGGGFGGAVMAFTGSTFSEADAGGIVDAYAAKFGTKPSIFHAETGDGAELFDE